MESLVDVAHSIKGNEQLALALGSERWTPSKLGVLKGSPEATLMKLARDIQEKRPELGFSDGDLEALIEASDNLASMERVAVGDRYRAALAAEAVESRDKVKINEVHQVALSTASTNLFRKPGKAVVTKWPTRLHKRLADAGTNVQLREQAEAKERSRWLKDLKDILDASGFGAGLGVLGCPELPNRVGKGRRAGTLRKHCKTWRQFVRWLQSTYGKQWPKDGAEFAHYLEDRANEPCARTVPMSAFKTLLFMEAAAEIPQMERISASPTVVNVLEEINLQMESQEARPGQATSGDPGHGYGANGDGRRCRPLHQGVRMVSPVQTLDRDEICRHSGHAHGHGARRCFGCLGNLDEDEDHGSWQEDPAMQGLCQQGGLPGGEGLAGSWTGVVEMAWL